MKTFELPVSDCGMFVAGIVDESIVTDYIDQGAPRYGIIVWYKDTQTLTKATRALMESHWHEPAVSSQDSPEKT